MPISVSIRMFFHRNTKRTRRRACIIVQGLTHVWNMTIRILPEDHNWSGCKWMTSGHENRTPWWRKAKVRRASFWSMRFPWHEILIYAHNLRTGYPIPSAEPKIKSIKINYFVLCIDADSIKPNGCHVNCARESLSIPLMVNVPMTTAISLLAHYFDS